jgi:hypothetical protein
MQLEGDAFYEGTEIVCSANFVNIQDRRSTTDSDGPFVCVVRRWKAIPLLLSQHSRSVSIDYWPKYA